MPSKFIVHCRIDGIKQSYQVSDVDSFEAARQALIEALPNAKPVLTIVKG